MKHALQVIAQQGGKVEKEQVSIRRQKPKAVKYEKSFENHYPVKKISVNKSIKDKPKIDFEGIGVVLKGYVQCPDTNYVATVEVYLDGKLAETAQLPVASVNSHRVDLFWKYQLQKSKHTVTFNWMNAKPDAQAIVTEVVIYSDEPNKLIYK